MSQIYEDHIEQLAIALFESLGYNYAHGGAIAPDGERAERASYSDVLLHRRLEDALQRINPTIDEQARQEAIRELEQISSTDLIANNQTFHKLLTEGIPVSQIRDSEERGERVWLIDFENSLNNDFLVCNQYTVVENQQKKRPDLILFINGIPLIVIELKNPTDENATIRSAFHQLETYKATIPSLFTYNAFNVISDGLEAQAGAISAEFSRYMTWKTADGLAKASHLVSQLETLIKGMLNKQTLVDLLRYFIVFEEAKTEDLETKIISITTVKKLASYHQYYAVNKAVTSTLRASGFAYQNTNEEKIGDRKAGVVWHTQGSGKSLSMVFYVAKIVLQMDNPTIVVITDRNDLDDQLFDTFASSRQLLRQDPVQAEGMQHLKDLLRVNSGGIVFTTIQKFQPNEGNVYETLSERENIVLIADEAHRTQYGFKAKVVDVNDAAGNKIGKRTVYGFAKYMRDALPNATYLGFTGTPIEGADINTPAVFGDYVDIYDIAQAVEDGATVPIYYESRLAKIEISDEGRQLVEAFDDELQDDELSESQKAKSRWTQLEALVGSPNRTASIAKDIIYHFEARQQVFEGKGLIVSMSRRIAVELYREIIKLRPHWHAEEPNKGAIKVIMTANSSDGEEMAKHHTTKAQRRALADRMKSPNNELKLVIVCDMWLTGFDAPSMHTLYIDKPMKGHNLMQAIARVNRVYRDKPGGLVVDYLGIASNLKEALSFYSTAGGKGNPAIAQEEAVRHVLEKVEIISQLFDGFAYENYFTEDTAAKLSIILGAEEHILSLDEGKKRFIDQVTALSQAYAIAVPHQEAMKLADEIAFFQAIKARLSKFDATASNQSNQEIETTIRQVIDKALVSEQVIDLFDAAGIKKPDISILSPEFMQELKDMKHKNIALEVLKKLLNDEIKARAKTNLVQSKSLMEMLENAIRKYHNKILTAAEVIDELIDLSKDIVSMDEQAEKLGLEPYEYAFYTAVADNDSAKELMEQETLRELAVVLTKSIRENASIDWAIKENVRAKLRVIVRRTLRRFGYPPDMQKLATDTVLKQAEMIAEELAATAEIQ